MGLGASEDEAAGIPSRQAIRYKPTALICLSDETGEQTAEGK